MKAHEIESYLYELGTLLQARQQQAGILVLGGTYMVIVMQSREATHDIDVSVIVRNAREYQAFIQAVAEVGRQQGLASDWLNDDVSLITDQLGRPKRPTLWKQFGSLAVYLPEKEYVFMLKCFSGRVGLLGDDRDIQTLGKGLHISSRAEAWSVIHAYLNSATINMRSKEILEAIERCFL